METVIKQTTGIDCGSEELVVSFAQLSASGTFSIKGSSAFKNSPNGFKRLLKWVDSLADPDTETLFVMEATGVYHENLAYFLVSNGCCVSIVLPNKVSAYAKTCTSKKQDDLQASRVLAEFACIKQLEHWEPPHPLYVKLRALSREKVQLCRQNTIILNQLHAEKRRALSSKAAIKRMQARTRLIEKQIEEIEKEIKTLIDGEPEVKNKVDKVCTIPGVGLQTVVSVIAETNGFNLIRNSRQLVSYAGLDVVQKLSGTSVRGRSHISKRGNPYLRSALFMPSFSAVRFNPALKTFYQRIQQRQSIKMKGYTAVTRKLLVLIYTLWKKDEGYTPDPSKFLEQSMKTALTELD